MNGDYDQFGQWTELKAEPEPEVRFKVFDLGDNVTTLLWGVLFTVGAIALFS